MENLLRANIERTISQSIGDDCFDKFQSFFFERSFDKKHILVQKGEPCKYVYFIYEGSAYSYLLDENGEKHAIQFALEGYWISDSYSFFSNNTAIYMVETLEPVRAFVLPKENFEKLCSSDPLFDKFFRILNQNAMVALQYRLAKDHSSDAMERYVEFSTKNSHFIQRIPQYLIASYLGIKPQSLSRIRNQLANK